jgi:pyruvate dehydrogenase E2 component (dihydrolipoamide acetyltransferase)
MSSEVVLPRLGWSMESGRLVEWLKKDGDPVQNGDMIFSVEGDKAVQEVEALENGILRILPNGPGLGEDIPVGTLLAYICEPGEIPQFEGTSSGVPPVPAAPNESTPIVSPTSTRSDTIQNAQVEMKISPRARRVANELALDWTGLQGTGKTGRIREKDIWAADLQRQEAHKLSQVTPLARRAAADLGINLTALSRESKVERITRADVEAAARRKAPDLESADLQPVAMNHIRRLIAEKMGASSHTTAPVTLTTEVDATPIFRMRKSWKNDPDLTGQFLPSYLDMLIKIVTQALTEYPVMNSRLEGENILYSRLIHMGIAVDTEAGLIVPVIRNTQNLGLKQIARETAALIEKAQSGCLNLNELGGGTFTITNLGMYDIDGFTPIINLPECAILGVGRLVPKVVVINEESEETAVRRMMTLSLTFDHRIVDGAPAARFLKRIKQLVEKPEYWLL